MRMAAAPMDPEQQKSLTDLFEFTKQMLLMKQQLKALSPQQIAGVQSMVDTLEDRSMDDVAFKPILIILTGQINFDP